MPTRIFAVKYEEKWTGINEWTAETLSVAASDVEDAIRKTKKHVLSQPPVEDGDGKPFKITGVRILGVTLEADADI